eukprot:11109253-Alexandrium_andersonii.AAC.1
MCIRDRERTARPFGLSLDRGRLQFSVGARPDFRPQGLSSTVALPNYDLPFTLCMMHSIAEPHHTSPRQDL